MNNLDPAPEQPEQIPSLMSAHLEYLRQTTDATVYKCNKHTRGILNALHVIQESSDTHFQLIIDKVSHPDKLLGLEHANLPPMPPEIEQQLNDIMQRFYDDYQVCVDWENIKAIFVAILKVIAAMKQSKNNREIFALFSKYVGEIAIVPPTLTKGLAYVHSLQISLSTDYGSLMAQDLTVFAAKLESVMAAITLIMHSLREHLLQTKYEDIHQAIIHINPSQVPSLANKIEKQLSPSKPPVQPKVTVPNSNQPKVTKKLIPSIQLEEMSDRERATRVDCILDMYNAKKITAEQMKANLTELGV